MNIEEARRIAADPYEPTYQYMAALKWALGELDFRARVIESNLNFQRDQARTIAELRREKLALAAQLAKEASGVNIE